ncbi:uncharacterized protein LOC142814206 isoform X1 [Rhipicephalus microplus]|uniref:uncharacterized protein LOC142814206 isoform X1 n=1 Tax=Rhipicephalus microplus TaxID=6941 RepID=UPI003F6D288B
MLLALSMCIHDHENETDRILAILSGETLNAVTHLNITLIIVVSTSVILLYTSKGGLASVLYTDVLQLCSTIMGLWCCVPFVARYGAVAKVSEAQKDWVGVISNNDLSQILDQLLMTIFGGIPWQVYFQRVLSSDSAFTAKMLSFLSAVGCVFLSLPPVIVGASGKSASFAIGLMTRALCGEPQIGIPVVLRLPLYDESRGQQFPFRTLCMLLSLASVLVCSAFAAYLFRSGHLEAQRDVWCCFHEQSNVAAQTARSVSSTNAPSNVTALCSLSTPAPAQSAGRQEVTDMEGTGQQRRENADRSSAVSRVTSDDKEKTTSQSAHASNKHRQSSGAPAEQEFTQEAPKNKPSLDAGSKSSGPHGVEPAKVARRKEPGVSEAEPRGARMSNRRPSVQGEQRARTHRKSADENRIRTANDTQSAVFGAAPVKSERTSSPYDVGSSANKRQSDAELKEGAHGARSAATPSRKSRERKDGNTPSKSSRAKKHK